VVSWRHETTYHRRCRYHGSGTSRRDSSFGRISLRSPPSRRAAVAQGLTCSQVSPLLGDAPRSVEYWVRHFEERGLAGLVEGARPGRPQRLSKAQLQEVDTVLRRAPSEVGLSGTLWDGKTLQVWLARRYGFDWACVQCQRRFHQCGFRLRKPRPLIATPIPYCRRRIKKTPGVKP